MDEMVKRAMQKWPNVPNVFGWLRLDRRGNWLLQVQPDRFERIGNTALVDFIGRNYERDASGRWYFQNGPQRVFVGLDYAPHVYRLGDKQDDGGQRWMTHAGRPAGRPLELLFDEQDNVVMVTELGPGLVADRDLPALTDGMRENGGEVDLDELLARLRADRGRPVTGLSLFGESISVAAINREALQQRFGFIAEPQPEAQAKPL
jgi:hypothetical protein